MRRIAGIISTIFVPPSFTVLVYFFFALTLENIFEKQLVAILTAAIFGFILPIVLFFYLRRSGKLSDNEALIKEERTLPFFAALLFYIVGFIILLFFDINIVSIALWFCYISNTILILVINKYWKISAHSMGASGHAAALLISQTPLFWVILILLPFIAWARYYLKCHDPLQILAGMIIGFFSTYLQMLIIIKYFYA